MAAHQPEVKRRIDEIHSNSKIARRAMELENEVKYLNLVEFVSYALYQLNGSRQFSRSTFLVCSSRLEYTQFRNQMLLRRRE